MSIKYPEKIVIQFKPSDELKYYVGFGIDTREGIYEWTIDRQTARLLTLHYANNFKVKLSYPKEETLVSVVMCSCDGREGFAKHAVKQFESQTYKSKELIIVNQGNKWIVGEGVEGITEVMVGNSMTNGEMRNIGDAISSGEYIMRMDDDDIFTERRIEMQIGAIKETGYPASSFTSYVTYFPKEDLFFQVNAWNICTGLLMYKKMGYKYEGDIIKGSDSVFAGNYYGLIVPVMNDPTDYIRIYHGGNISGRNFLAKMYAGKQEELVCGARLINDKTKLHKLEEAKKKYFSELATR